MLKCAEMLKRFIKSVIAYGFLYSGCFYLSQHLHRRAGKILVLCYHKISRPSEFSRPGMHTHPETFCKQIAFIRKHYQIICEAELIELIEGTRKYPSKMPCLITFDDGWADNYWNVFKRFNDLPVLVFLPIQLVVDGETLWQEKLAKILSVRSSKSKRLYKDLQDLVKMLKDRSMREITEFVESLDHSNASCATASSRILSIEQVLEMHNNGLDFGSHTLRHVILTNECTSTVKEEIEKSKAIIESLIKRQVVSLAYPNGDFNQNIIESTKKAGYKLGFTTRDGFFEANCENYYAIPRKIVHEGVTRNWLGKYSPAMFSFCLSI